MSVKISLKKMLISVFVVALNACGGGGNNSGSPTEFQVTPDAFEFSGPDIVAVAGTLGVCPFSRIGTGQEILISGGLAPYQIINTSPDLFSVDRTSVPNRDETFKVRVVGGCPSKAVIVVLDSLNRKIDLTVSSVPGKVTTPPAAP
jgi:hypothetical protein